MSLVQPELAEFGTAPSEKIKEGPPSVIVKDRTCPVSSISLVLTACVCAVLIPSRMLLGRGAPNDSGVFAYIGWAMNRGLVPYKDIWDHKGPLLYYLQFAGIRLYPASTFGIGLLELVALSIAFYLLFSVLSTFASHRVIMLIAVVSLFFVGDFCEGGNLTESWALLPLAIAHFASWRWAHAYRWWCAPVLGLCFASIFWLRPNMAVFPVVATLLLLHRTAKTKGSFTALLGFISAAATAMLLSCLILLPIFHFQAFHEFVEAYFGYNAAYSRSLSLAVRLRDTVQLLILFLGSGLGVLGLAGWVLGLRKQKPDAQGVGGLPISYLHILLVSLPLEFAGASLGGRIFSHYLLPLFPTLAILAGWLLNEIENTMREEGIERSLFGTIAALAIVSGLLLHSVAYAREFSRSLQPQFAYRGLANFIQHATSPQDKIVVVGGAEAAYLTYYAQRLAASRFVYQYPLVNTGNPSAASQRKEFLNDLTANRPAVVVFSNPMVGLMCFSDAECRKVNGHQSGADYVYDSRVLPDLLRPFISSGYLQVQDRKFGGKQVFVRRDIWAQARW